MRKHTTTRTEIARIATLIADTIDWLSACPLRKADAFFETAEYPLQSIREEIAGLAQSEEGLEHVAESIAAAVYEGQYGNEEEDEVAFWRQIAAMAE